MKKFDAESEALKQRLLTMGELGLSMTRQAVAALRDRDQDAIKQVRASEKLMDRQQMEVDDEAVRLITVYTPVASDLRFLLMATRISGELERMGDLARNMGKYIKLLLTLPEWEAPADLLEMGEMVCDLVDDAVAALRTSDVDKARAAIPVDRQIDKLDTKVFQDALASGAGASDVSPTVALILLARSLERIGDLATNICEEVIYMVSAEDIRHESV